MRVLLDENVPHDLIPEFAGHEVSTVQGLGWAGVTNGDLLERARATIDVFITMDRKLENSTTSLACPSVCWSLWPSRIECTIFFP